MLVAVVETGGSRADNSSIVQASSLVNLARQNRSQNQNTPVSRYESNQGTPLSAAGVSDRVAMRASSTPLGQNSDPGYFNQITSTILSFLTICGCSEVPLGNTRLFIKGETNI